MRNDEDMSEILDNNYIVKDFDKMTNFLKKPVLEGWEYEPHKKCIHLVPTYLHALNWEYKRLIDKLLAQQEDIFQPTIELELGINKFKAWCDLGASASIIVSLYMTIFFY